mmetsp:Transcript_28750/g.79176  ORF Transcript_28750/g.79176 Transcript_28750/m.79176 type:complete len:287 (+) Transcript_28750:958-1818(+)
MDALVMVAQFWTTAKEGPQRVPQVFRETQILLLPLGIVNDECGSLRALRDIGEHKTVLVNYVVLWELRERHVLFNACGFGRLSGCLSSCGRRFATGTISPSPNSKCRFWGSSTKSTCIPCVGRKAASRRCPHRRESRCCGSGRGLLICCPFLIERRVAQELLQHLRAADAICERQVASRRVQLIDKLVWPIAVRPRVREPRNLLSELVELFPALPPDLALHSKPELALAVMLPQTVYRAEIDFGDGPDFGEINPTPLLRGLASELNEQLPCLRVRGLEITGVQQFL